MGIEEEVDRFRKLHLATCGLSAMPPLAMIRTILEQGREASLIEDIYQAHGGDIPKFRQRNIVERLQALRDGKERDPPRGRQGMRRGIGSAARRQEATFAAMREFAGGLDEE